jgi:hypothetical protein
MKTFQEFISEAKRIKFHTVYHGTTPENKKKIVSSGFKEPGETGGYGKGVYGSTNRNVARDYSSSAGTKSTEGDRGIVQVRVPAKHMTNFKKNDTSTHVSSTEKMKQPETKAVRVKNAALRGELRKPVKPEQRYGSAGHDESGDYVIMKHDYASGKIVKNPSPILKSGKEKRTKTQPKGK